MRNILKKSLFIALGCMLSTVVWGATIYSSDFIANPTGAATSIDKGEFIGAPSWATGYSNCFHTTGSAGAVTITFTTPVDLSSYTNCKLKLIWGAESNRPVNLSVNNGSATQIDAVTTSADRNKVRTVDADISKSVTSITSLKFAGSGGGNSYYFRFEITGDQAGPSSDATLKSLKYDNTSVPSFSPSTYTYDVELTAGTTTVPTVTAEKNDSKASNPVITPATSLPGATTVKVTAEDGTTSLTYTINFTVASSYPKVLTATWANIAGTATIDEVNKTITGKVAQGTGLTAITPTFTGNNISSWTPQGAQNFSNGAVNYTFTNSTTSEQTTYAVTITEVPVVHPTSVSLDKTQLNLQVGANATLTATVLPDDATNKKVSWSTSDATIAIVSNGTVSGVAAGTATITVTTEDGNQTATCSVTVTDAPPTTLTLHEPEVYEAKEIAGGYNTPLVTNGGREYEVYYFGKAKPAGQSSDIIVAYTQNTQSGYLVTKEDGTATKIEAKDGWFAGTVSSSEGSIKKPGDSWTPKANKMEEFEDMPGDLQFQGEKGKESTTKISFHIKGYDQFSFVGYDAGGASENKHFIVRIDGVEKTFPYEKSNTIRRFDIATTEHLIEISAFNSSNCKFFAFSLRLAEEPRVKYIDGNDSTQIVYQTQEVAPIYYYTKYNSKGRTDVIWDAAKATDLDLTTYGSDQLGDTLVLGGPANCAVGVYSYHVVSYNSSDQETSSVPGKIKVETLLRPSSRDSVFDAFTGEEMDQIVFSYYALNPENDITLTWNGASPGNNVKGKVSGNKYIIHGVPDDAGSFKFTVSIAGGNSFNGELKVTSIDLSDHPVMYLYKNSGAYDRDGVYQYLTSGVPNKLANLIPRKAQETGTRDSYSKYDWILISNDVDADNPEVLALIKDNIANKPILNMQGFTYTADRLNWGEPNNGTMDTVSKNGCNIFIQQPNHPIFANIVYTQGTGKLQVLNKADKKSVMPININNCDSSICLATAYTRDIDDYYKDGEMQTIIHEVPFSKRGGKKYICFPLVNTKDNLTTEGKLLLKNIVTYLTNTTSSVALPELEMQSFIVHGYTAQIDQEKDLITLELTEEQFEEADSLSAEKPIITVKDSKTHVLPAADEELDLRYTTFLPKTFVVTDYINRRAYSFKLIVKRPQGIDEVYTAGQWVNIFDIYGRKIATTNEDVYTMELPHGMYIVVTENGGTIKIMR